MSNVRVCASLLVVVVGVSNATAIQSYPPIHPGIQLSTITTTTPSTKNQIRKKKETIKAVAGPFPNPNYMYPPSPLHSPIQSQS